MNTNLTANELRAALILVNECLAGMGGKRPADLGFDEFTWTDATVLMAHGYNAHEATGTFGALMEKGFVASNGKTRKDGKLVEEWFVTTAGWKHLDTVWDANWTIVAA